MNLLKQTIYKTRLDESWKAEKDPSVRRDKELYVEIPGKYGFVYPYSFTQLAVYIDSNRVGNRLPKAWKVIQLGDFEKTALFPDSALDRACTLIKAKRKRKYSSEALQALKERGKKLGTERQQQARRHV